MIKFSKLPSVGTHVWRKENEDWQWCQMDDETLAAYKEQPDNFKPIYVDRFSLDRIGFGLIKDNSVSMKHYVETYAKYFHRMIYSIVIHYETKKNMETVRYELTCNLTLLVKGENLFIHDLEEAIIRHEND